MKRKHFPISQMWRRGIGLGLTAVSALAISLFSASSLSASAGDRPTAVKAGSIPASETNVTYDEPFEEFSDDSAGATGSKHFRIPALITLENGDLLATADARWETTKDGGGLDTIASVSSDGGKTWHYSFPFFFPDSDGYEAYAVGGQQEKASHATTIIDPGIVEGPDGTVYCFADVNPTGSTTLYKTIGTGTGYVTVNGKRYLALTRDYSKVETEPTDNDLEAYPYYVGDFDANGYAKILTRVNSQETGYGVDEWYNLYTIDENGVYQDNLTQKQLNPGINLSEDQLYNDTDIQQNAFYKDSEFHVYSIGYIWVITSKDHGRTWEHPRNINDQIKRHENENAILVSPGKGITTKSGDILIGFYDHGGEENASLAYSTDNGETWKRTNDIPGASNGGWSSSENEVVELEDGTIRMFFRNGQNYICYADATKDPETGEYTMGSPVKTSESSFSGCNVTALSYSKKINGKQAVLVACPTASGRTNGKIFTYLINENNTMELFHTFSVPQRKGSMFDYSCLTELPDGSIGLLWETGWCDIIYDHFDFLDICPNADISGTTVSVSLDSGDTYTRVYEGDYTLTEAADSKIASVKQGTLTSTFVPLYDHVAATSGQTNYFSTAENENIRLSDAEFTFIGSGETWKIKNSAKNLYLVNESISNFFSGTAGEMKVTATSGSDTFRICKTNGQRYVIFYTQEMDFNANTNYTNNDSGYELVLLEKQAEIASDDELPGYKRVSSITSGKKYLISYILDGKVYVLYPQNGKVNQTKLASSSTRTKTENGVSITAVDEGYTVTVIDGIKYEIRVTKEYPAPSSTCTHSSSIKGVVPATCGSEGYTGDEICDICGGLVKKGTSIPSLGHEWDEGTVTKKVTETEDGEKVYTCKNDSFHTRTEIIYASAYTRFLNEYTQAVILMDDYGLYTSESSAALKEALETGIQIEESKGASRSAMYYNAAALQEARSALVKKSSDDLQSELSTAVASAQAPASQDGVSDAVWNAYTEAYEAASKVSASASSDEVWELLKAFTRAKEELDTERNELAQQARAAAAAELEKAVKDADAIYNAGQSDYTTDSWQAFVTAYNSAKNPPADADAAKLQGIKTALETAQSKLMKKSSSGNTQTPSPDPVTPSPVQKIEEGKVYDSGDYYYKVTSTSAKTAEVTGLKNKAVTKIVIYTSVKLGGETYKITSVAANAFKGNKKATSITLKKGAAKIGNNAFAGCTKVKKVTLKGTTLKTIGAKAFSGCKNLKSITIKSKVLKKVGKNAFKGIHKKATIKVPKASLKKYKTLLKKGQAKTVKIK